MSVSGHNLFSEILYLYIEVKYPKRIMAPPIACENRLLEKMHKMYHFYLQLVLLIYRRFHLGLQNLWALMGLQQTLIGNFFCNQIMRRNMYWASVCDTVQWTFKCQKNITVWIKKRKRFHFICRQSPLFIQTCEIWVICLALHQLINKVRPET